MIVKHYDKSIEVEKQEALEKRMPIHHPKRQIIQTDIRKKKAEIAGEKEVDYPLQFLDKDKYLILHNLRIKDHNGFFQMDTLILTEKYYLILEVKNWQGSIVFDSNGQVIRTRSEEEEGFPSPIPQVKMQKFRLQKWLRKHNLPELHIEALIVISFPTTIIKTASPSIPLPKQVIHNNQLYFKIMEFEKRTYDRQTSINNLYAISSS